MKKKLNIGNSSISPIKSEKNVGNFLIFENVENINITIDSIDFQKMVLATMKNVNDMQVEIKNCTVKKENISDTQELIKFQNRILDFSLLFKNCVFS